MRLRWYDRVLVSLSGLIIMAVGVCVILAAGGVITLPEPFMLDTWLGNGWQWMPLIFLVGLAFVAWGVRLLTKPLLRHSDATSKYFSVRDGDEGGIQISVQALDYLVHKCVDKRDEILSAHVRIGGQENAMRITLRATLRSGVHIPELVGQVRAEIKEYVERCAGVTVESVRFIVEATKEGRGQAREVKRDASAENAYLAETESAETVKLTEPIPELAVAMSESEVAQPEPQPVFVSEAEEDTEPPEPREPEEEPPEAYDMNEDTEDILDLDFDFGPDEPLPVTLSEDAFPFPEEARGIVGEAEDTTEEETGDA